MAILYATHDMYAIPDIFALSVTGQPVKDFTHPGYCFLVAISGIAHNTSNEKYANVKYIM
tara:strand:+ start:343 stop:522 length:180 start_codon:yes stop_codon:yes gene_type:complete